MSAANAFIPLDRRHALATETTLPDRSNGAVLFADISGFATLTGALTTELGPRRGAEELLTTINVLYERLIAELHRFGGNVIGFSGDAITCWLDDRPYGQHADAAAARAVAAALAMQAVMQELGGIATPSGVVVQLALKVAVAAGSARRFLVGDPARYVLEALAGRTLDRVAAAESQAASGEVILAEEVVRELDGRLEIVDWRAAEPNEHGATASFAVVKELKGDVAAVDRPEIAADALDEKVTRRWLAPSLHERLSADAGFLGDLRPAVPLFLKFSGLDYDDDDVAGDKLDAYVRWVQAIVDRYEGTIIQLTIGDKGSNLYIVFGAPVAHGDDVQRALAVALELRKLPPSLSFVRDIQIGIARGQLWTGACGASERRCYGVMGFPVNLAARLMGRAAPGQTLVEARTAESAAATYRIQPLGPMALKGLGEPIEVSELLGRRTVPGSARTGRLDEPIVGRERELAELERLLERARDGRPGAVLIVGEPGIGKTRLIEATLDRARRLGFDRLVGAGDAIQKRIAYHGWKPIFESLFGLEADAESGLPDPEPVLARLAALEPALSRRAPLLNAVLPLGLPDNELTAQMTGEVRAANTQELLVRLLVELRGERPFILVLDDTHWLDSASWALLQRLRRESDPFLLVLGSRPIETGAADAAPDGYAAIRDDPDTIRISLGPLAPEDALAFAAARLGVTDLPGPLIEFVRRRAEGHPFFIEELLSALQEAGMFEIVDGRCELAEGSSDLEGFGFPDTIEGVVTSRIDRMTSQQQLTLKVASVIGQVFAFRILEDVYPLDEHRPRLHDDLDVLSQREITTLESQEPQLAYHFKHAIIQEVVYNSILFAQRRTLHRAVAEWYERTHAPNLDPHLPLLAHHWERAEQPPKAVEYLEKAGEQALRSYANREAVTFLSRALRHADTESTDGERIVEPARALRWQRQLGVATFALGETQGSYDILKQTLEQLNDPEPAGKAQLTAGILKELARQLLHRLVPVRGLRLSRRAERERIEAARAFNAIIGAYYLRGNVLGAAYANFRALNLAESCRSKSELVPELADGYANVAAVLGNVLHLHRASDGYFRRARSTAESADHLPGLAWSLQVRGMVKMLSALLDEAERPLAEALEIWEELGHWRRWEETVYTLSGWHFVRGEFAPARQLAERQYESARKRDDRSLQILALCQQALALEAVGELATALETLSDAEKLLGDRELYAEAILTKGSMASVHARRAEHDAAMQRLREATSLFDRIEGSPVALEGYAAAADAALALWEGVEQGSESAVELKRLAELAIEALEWTASRMAAVYRARAGLHRARYLWAIGERRKAQRVWRKSLTFARRRGLPLDEARIAFELGRRLVSKPATREQHQRRAAELFQRMGAGYGSGTAI